MVPSKRFLFFLALLALGFANPISAEIQWVTGGVPENSPTGTESGGVKDTPEETGAWSTGNGGGSGALICHLTTCTKILNNYPADSVNYFFLNQHQEIWYYAYFLIRPTTRIHTAVVEWFSPTGRKLARQEYEFRVGFTDKILTINGENYQWFMATSMLGMSQPNLDSHQMGLPRDVGLYTVHLQVDGQPVGITFFYVREPDKTVQPLQSPVPNNTGGGAGAPAFLPPLPLSTPVSSVPLDFLLPKK
jgi:hypothetical protein